MKLSELKEGYLYKDYDKRGWCRNGTFEVKVGKDRVYIRDTYWSDKWFTPKEEYVENFEEVLKLDEYNRTIWSNAKDYEDKDVIQVHFNQCSGRFGFDSMDYFVKKDAKKDKEIKIKQLEEAIENGLRHLEDNKRTLEKLKNGEIKVEHVFIWQ